MTEYDNLEFLQIILSLQARSDELCTSLENKLAESGDANILVSRKGLEQMFFTLSAHRSVTKLLVEENEIIRDNLTKFTDILLKK